MRSFEVRKIVTDLIVACNGTADGMLLDNYRSFVTEIILRPSYFFEKTVKRYWIPRLIKQRPDLYEKLQSGEIPSVRQAKIAAGWMRGELEVTDDS